MGVDDLNGIRDRLSQLATNLVDQKSSKRMPDARVCTCYHGSRHTEQLRLNHAVLDNRNGK